MLFKVQYGWAIKALKKSHTVQLLFSLVPGVVGT